MYNYSTTKLNYNFFYFMGIYLSGWEAVVCVCGIWQVLRWTDGTVEQMYLSIFCIYIYQFLGKRVEEGNLNSSEGDTIPIYIAWNFYGFKT
jgi:hypothetical protein